MSQFCIRLIALVAVLCICMVPRVSLQSQDVTEPMDNHNTESSDVADNSKAESIITSTSPHQNGTLGFTATTDTPPTANTSNTYGDDDIITNNSLSNGAIMKPTSAESTTMKPTSAESTTMKPTSAESTTTKFTSTSTKSAASSDSGKGAGIFILIVIIILVFFLVAILYIVWKKGKKYSFDLTSGEHGTPLRSMEHSGIFEATKGSTTNLDYIQENSLDKTNPVANGCSGETPDQTSCSEQPNVPEEDSFTSDLSLDSPVKKVEFNLDLELIGREPELPKQETDEPTDNNDNENNNNDTNTGADSADLFTEINLDDTQ